MCVCVCVCVCVCMCVCVCVCVLVCVCACVCVCVRVCVFQNMKQISDIILEPGSINCKREISNENDINWWQYVSFINCTIATSLGGKKREKEPTKTDTYT